MERIPWAAATAGNTAHSHQPRFSAIWRLGALAADLLNGATRSTAKTYRGSTASTRAGESPPGGEAGDWVTASGAGESHAASRWYKTISIAAHVLIVNLAVRQLVTSVATEGSAPAGELIGRVCDVLVGTWRDIFERFGTLVQPTSTGNCVPRSRILSSLMVFHPNMGFAGRFSGSEVRMSLLHVPSGCTISGASRWPCG